LRHRSHPTHWQQVAALLVLDAVIDAANRAELQFVVGGGTLLGAVRESRFAGRPSDVDIRLLGDQEDAVRFVGYLRQTDLNVGRPHFLPGRLHIPIRFESNFFRPWRVSFESPFLRRLFSMAVLLDLEFQGLVEAIWTESNCFEQDMSSGDPGQETNYWTIDEDLSASIYGRLVRIPDKWEDYLLYFFGPTWRIPHQRPFQLD
jgi:hypothetical protein